VRVGCVERVSECGVCEGGFSLLLGTHSDTALRDPAEERRRSGTLCLCMRVNFPNFQGKHYTLVLLRITITNDDE